MTTTETIKSYLTSYKLKRQEYLLEQSLKGADIERAQGEMAKAVKQISMGPFIFEPQYNSLQVSIMGNYPHMYLGLRYNEGMVSKEMFLEKVTGALESCAQQDCPERRETDKGYAKLILQLIRGSDAYDCIIKAYEHYNTALKALDELCKGFQAWNMEVWNNLYDVAVDWCTNKDNIKPGTEVEIINLKNYTSQVKRVWKLVEKDNTTKVVFKDNTRLSFPSQKIGAVGTWVLSHPEYKPLLDYLREMEDELSKK